MNSWQQGFVRKLESVKRFGVERFENAADQVLLPIFEQFEDFTNGNGFQVSAPVNREGVRTFKFSLSENAYVLVSFKASGTGRVECQGDAFVPGHGNLEPVCHAYDLADFDDDHIRGHFEESLDYFVNNLSETLSPRKQAAPKEELVGAGK